jgi:hypothetical protein
VRQRGAAAGVRGEGLGEGLGEGFGEGERLVDSRVQLRMATALHR